jgi:hypothetical protein
MGLIICPYRSIPKLLLHPEIQLTSNQKSANRKNNNQPASSIPPSGLSLSQGILANLFDHVVQYRSCEDTRNGINLDKLLAAGQRKETGALRRLQAITDAQPVFMLLQAGTCWVRKWSITS